MSEEASCAAFSSGESEVSYAEHKEDYFFEAFTVRGEDGVVHLVLDFFSEFVDAGLCLIESGFGAEEVELDFSGTSEDGGVNIGILLIDGGRAGVYL